MVVGEMSVGMVTTYRTEVFPSVGASGHTVDRAQQGQC